MISAITRHREASVNPLNSLTRPSQAPTTTTSTTIIITTIPATKITTAALVCEDGVGDDDDYDEVDKDDFLSFRLRSTIAMVYIRWTPQKPTPLTNLLCARGLLQPEESIVRTSSGIGAKGVAEIYLLNVIRYWNESCHPCDECYHLPDFGAGTAGYLILRR